MCLCFRYFYVNVHLYTIKSLKKFFSDTCLFNKVLAALSVRVVGRRWVRLRRAAWEMTGVYSRSEHGTVCDRGEWTPRPGLPVKLTDENLRAHVQGLCVDWHGGAGGSDGEFHCFGLFSLFIYLFLIFPKNENSLLASWKIFKKTRKKRHVSGPKWLP